MEREFQILLREFDNPQDAKKAAQAKAAAAKAAAAKAAAQAKAALAKELASAQKLAKELQPFFKQVLSRQLKPRGAKITYGPAIGGKVNLAVVADSDFAKASEAEAKRLAARLQQRALKFAPDVVQRRLIAFYKAQGQALPSRLSVVDEKTRLTPDEDAAVFSIPRAITIAEAQSEAAKVDGFYSTTTKTISLRQSAITAGAIAHEMTHAYAHPNWDDFIFLMQVRGMKETDKLNEGMTSHLSGLVIDAWFAKQSGGTIPSTGYGPDYIAIAEDFIKEVGQEAALTAFFGGFVDFTDNDKPEDSLLIGSAKKKWKWKWR
jgi:hypothetical protein